MSQASNNPQNTPKKEKKNKQDWKEQAKKLPLLRRLSHNTSLKVLSLVFAIIIRAVTMSQTNPPRKKIVYDVPIEITGLQSLTSRDLALKYTPEEMEGTVDVVLEVPFIANAFGFTPVSWTEYGIALGLAVLVIPVVELVKAAQRAAARRRAQ